MSPERPAPQTEPTREKSLVEQFAEKFPSQRRGLAYGFEDKFVSENLGNMHIIELPSVTRRVQTMIADPTIRERLVANPDEIEKMADETAEAMEKRARELSTESATPIISESIDSNNYETDILIASGSSRRGDNGTYYWVTASRTEPDTMITIDVNAMAEHDPTFVEERIKDLHTVEGLKNIIYGVEEYERKLEEEKLMKLCTESSIQHAAPQIFPFTKNLSFETKLIIDASKKDGELLVPGITDKIQEKVHEITDANTTSRDRKYAIEGEDKAHMTALKDRAHELSTEHGVQLYERLEGYKQFDIRGSAHMGFIATVRTDYGSFDIDMTALAEHDPEFVSDQLKQLLIVRGAHEIIEAANHAYDAHHGITFDDLIVSFDTDDTKRAKEIPMVQALFKEAGSMNDNATKRIREELSEYKPDQPSIYNANTSFYGNQTTGGYLEHAKICQTTPPEEIPTILKYIDVANALKDTTIETTDNPILQNPLYYTEQVISFQEKQLQDYEAIHGFVEKSKETADFSEYMATMAKEIPALYKEWTKIRDDVTTHQPTAFKDRWMDPLLLQGFLSKISRKDVERTVQITYEPLEDLMRLMVLKYTEDRIKKQQASYMTSDGEALSGEFLLHDDRIATLREIVGEIETKVKEQTENPQEKRADFAAKRTAMKTFLAENDITEEVVTKIMKSLQDNNKKVSESRFAITFHLYRLQKAGVVDIESPVLRRAVMEFFEFGVDAVPIVEDLVMEEQASEPERQSAAD